MGSRRLSRIGLVAAIVLLLAASSGLAAKDSDSPIVAGDLGKRLSAAVARAGGPDFWGAVLVAKDGEIVLAKGYGMADYASTPNTPRTLFELASASKQVAAAAILHLEEKRKLSVTDSIAKHVKGIPKDKHAITIHHLLTHTSGLSGKIGVPYNSPISRKAYIESMLATPLATKPGEKFGYSNVGYALLAAIVEEVTGKTFEAYCERNLFKPAKMADTGFINDRDLVKTGRASKRKSDRGGDWSAAKWHWGWGYKGMGGVVTTVLDLHRWDRALRDDRILSEESKQKLFTPEKGGYACGWRVNTTDRGTRKAHHSGSVAGYGTNVVHYVDEDVFLCVLSNHGQKAYEVSAAIEPLLFAPVKIAATIDVKPYDLGKPPILKLPKEAVWKASATKKEFVLKLVQGRHAAFTLRAPAGYEKKLRDSLAQAIRTREAGDDGAEAATETTLYLQPYSRLFPKFTLTEKLTFEILPEYRHRDGVDARILLVLRDAKYGQWPMMALLNVAAAKELLAAMPAE